tara:strand:+ start:69 stop:338 length:270 start_codon:yes stop_codon:yes gene_type:complete
MSTKALIVKKITKDVGLSYSNSKAILDNFVKLIISSKFKHTKIKGFGTFSYHQTPKRIGRNPKTKESYIIKPMIKPIFRASKKVKETLN